MSDHKKQQKNRRDSIKDSRFHVLPPPRCRATLCHISYLVGLLAAVSGGLQASQKLWTWRSTPDALT